MKHLGDITKISGYDVHIVDVVIGGSPCQGLSVAGKGEGLADDRSGLFMEQIRIIKEMRDADRARNPGRPDGLVRPRFMVWENVPGAFSSNNAEDFRIVLEETARVAQKDASIPRFEGWHTSGCIMGDGWSIAWRVFDAQFWGVAQRRRRIALVADFGGQSAPEILFVRKGMSGDIEKSGEARKGIAGTVERGAAGSGKDIIIYGMDNERRRGGDPHENVSPTITARCGTGGNNVPCTICIQGNVIEREVKCNGKGWKNDVSYTLNTIDRHAVYDARGNGDGSTTCTITGDHENRVTDYTAIVIATGQANAEILVDKCPTIVAGHEHPICIDRATCNQGENAKYDFQISADGVVSTIVSKGSSAVMNYKSVRRLTPLECERLQGFPDGWTDIGEWTDSNGKKHQTSDAARYKALGNSIAIPPWKYVIKRLCAWYERDATMASFFDGIGGFPMIWEQFNGKGSCIWASEIDEFPMAVTKFRIGE